VLREAQYLALAAVPEILRTERPISLHPWLSSNGYWNQLWNVRDRVVGAGKRVQVSR